MVQLLGLGFGRIGAWLGSECLQYKFVRLFLNSEQNEECIERMRRWMDSRWEWDFRWRREWFE